MKTLAYCYRTGEIGFTDDKLPKGCLPIARGDAELMARVEVHSRRAYDNVTLLVPGIPEANSDQEALDALFRFRQRFEVRRG